MVAYVCRITEANFSVIASEKPDFDLKEVISWLNAHEKGYFLRDPDSVFDCKYIHDDVFSELYSLVKVDEDALFRQAFKRD